MAEQNIPSYQHVIVITVGLSVIDKTLKKVNSDKYQRWMPSPSGDGELARCDVSKVENGDGLGDQLEVERKCFKESQGFSDVGIEISRKRQNRHSAEVSSLYLLLEDKGLKPNTCRVVLVATDSAAGVFAARLNKRIIAHRIFHCPDNIARDWKNEGDNHHDKSLSRLPIIRVPGLQVEDAAKFESSGNDEFEKIIKGEANKVRGGEKLLNITGGFKGIIPVASGVAWRYNWDVAYLYEDTDRLIYSRRPGWMLEKQDYEGPAVAVSLGSIG